MSYISLFVGGPLGVYLILLAHQALEWDVWGAAAILTALGTWLLIFALAGWSNLRGS